VRVIGEEGEQLGVLDIRDAIRAAREKGLDLVEVAATADPPVCRIIDFGKFQYEAKKKANEAKKKQVTITVKEVKFRPGTDDHDYDYRMKHAREWLEGGDKVKATIWFRGREMTHRELGARILEKLEKDGLILREHGGAYLKNIKDQVQTFSLTHQDNLDKKELIAAKCIEFIESGDTIILDSGSTTTEVAKKLKGMKNLTIITNALNIALMLGAEPGIEVISGSRRYLWDLGERAVDFASDISRGCRDRVGARVDDNGLDR